MRRVFWLVMFWVLMLPKGTTVQAQAGTTLGEYLIFAQPVNPVTATYTVQSTVGSFRPNTQAFSANIYYFDTIAPGSLSYVTVTNGYRNVSWPIPAYAEGSSGDEHLVVVVRDHGLAYEMIGVDWNAARTVIEAWTFMAHPLAGGGRSDGSTGNITASGFAVTAGMVTRDDFLNPSTGLLDTSLQIGHALSMSLPRAVVGSNRYVLPATCGESSGQLGANGIPLGQRYALPSTLNVDALDVHPFTREVLRAARDYGVYVNDTNTVPFENGKAVGTFRVEPGLLEELYTDVSDADDFRVTVGQEITDVVSSTGLYILNADATQRQRVNGNCSNPDVRGDVNLDGIVSPLDAAFVANRIGAPFYFLTPLADVDYNGSINEDDADDVFAVMGSVVE